MKKKALLRHIMDVDNNHGEILVEQEKRIEELEYKVANLVRVIENNSKQWLNTPVDPTDSIIDEVNKQRHHKQTGPYPGASPEIRKYREGMANGYKVTCVVTGAEEKP